MEEYVVKKANSLLIIFSSYTEDEALTNTEAAKHWREKAWSATQRSNFSEKGASTSYLYISIGLRRKKIRRKRVARGGIYKKVE